MEMALSQEGLAERADLHRTYIADIERGVRNLSLRNIEKLAQALDMSIADLSARHWGFLYTFPFPESCGFLD